LKAVYLTSAGRPLHRAQDAQQRHGEAAFGAAIRQRRAGHAVFGRVGGPESKRCGERISAAWGNLI